ncbi:MAG: radical SAM protein [Acidobacteria bacterium]|nr:radical SAM protein [Acidobacteriota bacterium]
MSELVVLGAEARRALAPTSGFIARAGFTHSLTPARNCTYGCTYCYVPTMRIYGGLKPEDWRRWGQFTTMKSNVAELLARGVREHQAIYCSPLVDPYQPAEEQARLMPGILKTLIGKPPRVFVLQARGPLILRDLSLLAELASRTVLRVSFSVTTNQEEVRRRYEPLCASIAERLAVVAALRGAGIAVHVTLAPLLPCDPEELAARAVEASRRDLVGDPLHTREVKRHGATTRDAAYRVAAAHGEEHWFAPEFQSELCERIRAAAWKLGVGFALGPEGFSVLSRPVSDP